MDFTQRANQEQADKTHQRHEAAAKLCCQDILFTILDDSLRKIEPIISKFYTDEALVLNQLSINLSHYEQLDFVRRGHMAQKMLI